MCGVFFFDWFYFYSIDHTDVEIVIKHKFKQFVISRYNYYIQHRYDYYIQYNSDNKIHVIMEHKFKTFPYLSNIYKGRVQSAT
jgi:hypothetical protein